jgi:UTP--glucose-1-phosphate uridylyltransferase
MRNELNRLVQNVSDPGTKRVRPAALPVHPRPLLIDNIIIKVFDTEMQSFFYLFTRYLTEKAKSQELYAISTHSGGL